MVTETVHMIVLQRILAVVQPHVVRLALIERAAVVGDEGGEVQVAAVSGVVSEVDGTSAIFRHGSSFHKHGGSVATNVPWMIAVSILMIVLQWILAVVQPDVIRLTLVECAAVTRNEHGEVQVTAIGCIVSKVDWSGL